MEKVKKKIDIANTNQLNLFDIIQQVSERQKSISLSNDIPGRLNISATLRELVSHGLKHPHLNRYGVAAEMSKLLGKEITKSMLDRWSAESKENHRFPLDYLNAFIEVTGDKTILRLICEKAGGYFIEGEDALLTELGRIEKQKEEIAKKEKLIRQTLEQLGVKK